MSSFALHLQILIDSYKINFYHHFLFTLLKLIQYHSSPKPVLSLVPSWSLTLYEKSYFFDYLYEIMNSYQHRKL